MHTRLLIVATVAALVAGAPGALLAQEPVHAVSGVVRLATGAPVAGAAVSAGPGVAAETDDGGRFTLRLPVGRHALRVSHPACEAVTREIDVRGPLAGLDIRLTPLPRFEEAVVVAAVRADAEAPMTKRELDRREIESLSTGQEMPFLLKEVPSVTQYSDSGSSTGYSYIYLRGIPQTRMNVTLDGVPLNEPEDSAFYFANFGDFANAIESLQVQRGVGTSTVGAASFVGSINFASIDLKDEAAADVRAGRRLVRHEQGERSGPLGEARRRHEALRPGGLPGHGRVPAQFGFDAAQRVCGRHAGHRLVVLQVLRLRRAGGIAVGIPGGRRRHARPGLAVQSDEPRRTRRVRPAFRHGPVSPRVRARHGTVGAGVLQRR